jgi:hypothetical protein
MPKQKNFVLASFATMLVLTTGCSNEPDENVTKIEVKIPEQQNKFLQLFSLAKENYTEVDGDIYMYAYQPAERENSEGKSASILEYKYLGQDRSGFHLLGMFDQKYGILTTNKCKNPCKVIYRDDEKIPFSESTIIGSAFEDVLNGRISIAKGHSYIDENKFKENVYVKRINSLPQKFNCNWVVDGAKNNFASFLIFKNKKAIIVMRNNKQGAEYDIDHIDVKNIQKNQYIYDIILSGNTHKITISYDWKSDRMLGQTTDNQWTEFTAKNCREDP